MDIRPLTRKQQKFAEENHNLVYAFLNKNSLSEATFYDVVIFGYLRAVQEYCDTSHSHKQRFSTLAWKRMRSALSNYYRYLSRAKRNAPTVSFDEMVSSEGGLSWADIIPAPNEQMMKLETDLLLHTLAASLPPLEMRVVRMKVRGDRMHDIAKAEHLTFQQINRLLENAYPAIVSIIQG